MQQGFRYKLSLVLSGKFEKSIVMKVGVLFSNGTEIGTLDKRYLRRSMG